MVPRRGQNLSPLPEKMSRISRVSAAPKVPFWFPLMVSVCVRPAIR
jgi:hypothetical protein